MADNRIYIRCKECGKELFLGKRIGIGYYWNNYGKENNESNTNNPSWKKQDDRPLEERLNEFFEEHELCGDSIDYQFEIAYEFPPEDDVEPVRHGRNIHNTVQGHCEFKCSLCGAELSTVYGGKNDFGMDGGYLKYCPNCGAHMDQEG